MDFPFTIINADGSEKKVEGDEARDFWAMVQRTSDSLTERDGGGQWAAAADELNRTVPGLALDHMGGYVPIQGYGTYQGEECYFRSRYEYATFSVGTYDKDPVDWLTRLAVKIPGCRRIYMLNGHVTGREAANWLRKIVVRVPGLRKDADVSSWMPKRQACAKVADDEFGAGYLTPAECVMIIREILIPNLQVISRKQGREEIKAFSRMIDRMKEAYSKGKTSE